MSRSSFNDGVTEALAAMGMRPAGAAPGWYVKVLVDGESVSVWATDEPEDDDDR